LVLVISMMLACQTKNQDQEKKHDQARSIIKMYYQDTPVWRSKEIAYSKGFEKKAITSISYEQWQHILNNKFLFIYPDDKFQLFEGANEIPSDIRDKKQTAAYVLGKIKLTDEIGGLLVLEEGYYSLTRIMIYPIDAQGNSWSGIEVADWFADDNEELKIASKTIKDKIGIKVVTTVTEIIYKDDIYSKKDIILSKDIKRFTWRFDSNKGFILMDKGNK
jgi:hypothetical protein